MTNPESLTMLAPKSIRLGHVPGGIPEVTPEDIAGAMRHLDSLETELLRVKYVGDGPHRLFDIVKKRVRCEHDLTHGVADRVTVQALQDVVGVNRCQSCRGTKEAMLDGVMVVCPDCQGSGVHYVKGGHQHQVDLVVRWLSGVEFEALRKVQEFSLT
jgi:Zn finger protein HypA/HybF involved in hydrogenase expression